MATIVSSDLCGPPAVAAASPSLSPRASPSAAAAAESPLDRLLRTAYNHAIMGSGGSGGGSGSGSGSASAHGHSSSPWSVGAYPGLLEQMRVPSLAAGRERRARQRALESGSWQKILTHVIETTKAAATAAAVTPGAGARRGVPGSAAVQAAALAAAAASGGSGSVAAVLDGARRGLSLPAASGTGGLGLSAASVVDEVYGLGGGYNPLAKSERARTRPPPVVSSSGGGGTSARVVREPDTEAWAQWAAEDWKGWKEFRARERERLAKLAATAAATAASAAGAGSPGGLSSFGDRCSSAAGLNPAVLSGGGLDSELLMAAAAGAGSSGAGAVANASKSKRDDLKASVSLSLDLGVQVDMDSLDHIHSIRHTHAHGGPSGAHGGGASAGAAAAGGRRGAAKRQQLAKLRAADARFEREQKERAAALYRNVWTQQMRVVRSNRSLAHYADSWDRKLSSYKLTLERDAQGNRIRAWHQMDGAERARVVAAQTGDSSLALEALHAHTTSATGALDPGAASSDEERADFASGSDDEDGGGSGATSHGASSSAGGGGLGAGGSGIGGGGGHNFVAQIRKLQASNPHKHQYHGSMSARNAGGRYGPAGSMAELAATGGPSLSLGSLSARAHASAVASASTFEAMLTSGLAAQQQQSAGSPGAAAPGAGGGGVGGGGGKNRSTLFHRAILSLRNRKAIISFDEREQNELKDIFDLLARDGPGSKITKQAFKTILVANFGAAGAGPVMATHAPAGHAKDGHQPSGAPSAHTPTPAPTPLHIDRVRIEPLLDRLWLAVNSTGRSSTTLDFADFTQMVGLALQGSLEDKAAFAFEVADLDEDGVLDVHDLFVSLHLSMDTCLPRDFLLLASALHGKMEGYDQVWRGRQNQVLENAAWERERAEWARAQQAARNAQQQQAQAQTHASDASLPPSHVVSFRDLHLQPVSDLPPPPPPPPGASAYTHQELPSLHVTKVEYIRLHVQAHAYTVASAQAAGGEAAQAQAGARPGSSHTGANTGAGAGSGTGMGAAAFRAASLALQAGSTSLSSSSGAHGGGGAGLGPALHGVGSGSVDLVEMIAKAFFYPYRKAGGRLGASMPSVASASPGVSGAAGAAAGAQGAGGQATGAGVTAQQQHQSARELQKERSMAQGGVKFEEFKSNTHPSGIGPVAPASRVGAALVHSARVARENRRSVHGIDEVKANSLALQQMAAQQQQQQGQGHHPAQASFGDAAALSAQQASSEVEVLLQRLRTAGGGGGATGGRLSKLLFRKLMLGYLHAGPNRQFHALNPAQAAQDHAEDERVVEFLWGAMDFASTAGRASSASMDAAHVAAVLGPALRGDPAAQMHAFHRLLDLDRDGVVGARDLCMAHDMSASYTLRTDLKLLLELFSAKIEGVILRTRAGHGSTLQRGAKTSARDVLPEPMSPTSVADAAPGRDRRGSNDGDESDKHARNHSSLVDPTVAAERSAQWDAQSAAVSSRAAAAAGHAVGLTLEEFNEALLKFNSSFFLKILRRLPYQRSQRAFVAATTRHVGRGVGSGLHAGMHGVAGKGDLASAGSGVASPLGGTGMGDGSGLGGGGADGSGNPFAFEELSHLHRSLMRELRVSTQQDFSKFPDAHNSNIGEQITALRRSAPFQLDCQLQTRIYYLAHQFLKPAASSASSSAPSQPHGHSALTGTSHLAPSASASGAAGVSSTLASLEHAYTLLSRLLTRVPQVYLQWLQLQDGSKHTSVETAKFRKSALRYALVSREERRGARHKAVVTPGFVYAFGGFPRPRNAQSDRADLQHYGTPLRCLLVSVVGAQLNEEGLDDVDFVRRDGAGNKFVDQPLLLLDLVGQVHLWLSAFADQVDIENARAASMGTVSTGRGGSAAAAAAAAAAASVHKTGLLRVVPVGCGNFAAVPGIEEHQGPLISYLLMHAFLINLRRHSVTTVPDRAATLPSQQPLVSSLPLPKPPAAPSAGGGLHARHRSHNVSATPSVAAAASAAAAVALAAQQQSAASAAPVTSSLYRNLAVLEFISFDEALCPIAPDANGRRMVGGVELRFLRCDVLELTTAQTAPHHVGVLVPGDSFALPGNEDGYTSLASMIGNNTSLRLHQGWHFNPHLLHQPNFVPVELSPELLGVAAAPARSATPSVRGATQATATGIDADAAAPTDLWADMQPVLVDPRSPLPWVSRDSTPEPEAAEEEDDDASDAQSHQGSSPQLGDD